LIKAKSNSILSDYEVKSKTTVIGNYAFSYCTKLTSVSIPANVIGIGNYAFEGCDKLTNVYYTGTEEEWNSIDVENYNDELLGSNVYYNCCEVHTWNDGEVIKEATCTSKGTKKYACTICSVTKTESIDKISHTSKKTVTKATTKANGKITYTCSVCGATTKKATTIYYPKTITLSATTYTYNGKAQKPTVKVVDANGKTVVSSNYTVTYASGCKNVGSYKVTIKFKGNYSGTVTKTFKINPKGTSVSSLTAKSNGFAVNWKKQATQTTGYQIQYSTSSNFSNAKTVTVSKNSTTSKTISKLTGKKKYYVRVRTYKTVDGTKYYSSWSSAKSVTTKSSASSNAVYRTPSGKCYHYSANCGGKNSYKITMAQAKSAGLKPCKKCVL
jgi:hypothetical protein